MFRFFGPYLLLPSILAAQAVLPPTARDQPPGSPTTDKAIVLERFVVVSDRLDLEREAIVPNLGAAQFHIDRLQLQTEPSGLNAGFSEVLLRVPGVAQDSFGQLHVRGEHADLQYRINDVLLPEGLTGFGQELDTRFVESVNVLTGALPAQFGYRTAGVVDIHTRDATSNGGDVALYGGSFGTFDVSLEGTASACALHEYVTASTDTSGLGIENPTPARTAIHDHKTQQRLFSYLSYVIDDTSRLNLMLSASFSRFQIPNNPGQTPVYSLAGVPTFNSADLNEDQREENHYAILSYQKTSGAFSSQISVYGRDSLVAFSPDRAGDLIFDGVASAVHRTLVGNGIEADAMWSAGANHTVRFGLLATTTNAGTRTMTSVFSADATGAQISDVPFDIADDHRKLGVLAGLYAQDEWVLRSRLTMNVGARIDTLRGYLREGQLSPRVNLVYQLGNGSTAHLGYARYFTPPPLELVQTTTVARFIGTTNQASSGTSSPVRAERSHYFDAGVSTSLGRGLSLSLDAYDKRSTNLLDEGQFGTALIFSPFNYRTGSAYGAELAANCVRGGFTAYLNAAVSRATGRQIASGEFQFDPAELDSIARHDVHLDHDQLYTASAGTSYRDHGTLIYVGLLYGSGLRRGFANTGHLPPYYPANVGVEHTFELSHHRELRARLDVTNVFDKRYELRDGSGIGVGAPQHGSRRGVFGGATLAF